MTQSFSGGSDCKASACNVGDLGSIPGSGRSPGEGNGTPLQYSCLENPMDRGAWQATVHGVVKSQTRLATSLHFIIQMGEKMNYFLFQGTLRILASRSLIWQRRKQSEMEFVHGPLRSNTSAKIRCITFFLLMN